MAYQTCVVENLNFYLAHIVKMSAISNYFMFLFFLRKKRIQTTTFYDARNFF